MSSSDPHLKFALGTEFAHCQKLLEAVTEFVQRWKENGGRASETLADALIQSIFARSTRTYEAVVEHLGNRGFAEQGAMLNRSLFEDMVDARWVSLNPDLAVERLRQHERYSQWLRLDVEQRFPDYLQGSLKEFDAPMSDDERKQLRGLFGAYGEGSWTGLSLYARFKAIEASGSETLARPQADFVRAWVHRQNNETLHLSSFSLANLGSPESIGGELQFRLGSTERFLTDVLWCAFWTYAQTVWFVFDTFGLRVKDELDAAVVQPAFAAFAEAARATPWRDQPASA